MKCATRPTSSVSSAISRASITRDSSVRFTTSTNKNKAHSLKIVGITGFKSELADACVKKIHFWGAWRRRRARRPGGGGSEVSAAAAAVRGGGGGGGGGAGVRTALQPKPRSFHTHLFFQNHSAAPKLMAPLRGRCGV